MEEGLKAGSNGGAATVVLVHGAWHGAWCWERVVDRLRSTGVHVVPVDLPGHGADSGPLLDLHGDAKRVGETLEALDGPAVLVGHSYGGAVITEAGAHRAVSHLVYVCALVLDTGETCVSAAANEPDLAGISHEGRPNLGDGLIVDDHGAVTLDPTVAENCLYNDCDDETVAWALERLGPHPRAALQQSPAFVAWQSKPSTYVVCSEDMAIHPELQRILAKRCTTSVEWGSGHSPFLSRPDALADLLGELSSAG